MMKSTLVLFLQTLSLAAAQHHGPCTPDENGESAYYANHRALPVDDLGYTPCTNGYADVYACKDVDLMSLTSIGTLTNGQGASLANDVWGWVSPNTGKEYALVGLATGTSFVDVTTPESPVTLGILPTHTANSSWRDIKVYNNHAYIVSEAPGHGMQVFDLTTLDSLNGAFQTFTSTSHYNNLSNGNCHNVFINEDSGKAYLVGCDGRFSTCRAGLHIVDISIPGEETYLGCYGDEGYTHDVQCVNYNGPDPNHQNKEICFASNENEVSIIDVSNPQSAILLSDLSYSGAVYVHQGWLTEDKKYFLVDDEVDTGATRTIVYDVTDLTQPKIHFIHYSALSATDHNMYVKGNLVYQSNYRAGLRILDLSDIDTKSLTETSYFDVYPGSNSGGYDGTWSNYPYLPSGNIIVGSIERGLFMVKETSGSPPTPTPPTPTPPTPTPPTPNPPTSSNLILYESFERNFDIFSNGGNNAVLWRWGNSPSYPKKVRSGNNSAILSNDNGKKSSIFTKKMIDVASYSTVRLTFSFLVEKFENGESILVQVAKDGEPWSSATAFSEILGTTFYKKHQWNEFSEDINVDGVSSIKIRIQCDASTNMDKAVIDDIKLYGSGADRTQA